MKKAFLLTILCFLFVAGFAGNVITVQEAKTVSKNYLTANISGVSVSASDLVLRHTEVDENGDAVFYVFSIRTGGFIIAAASDAVNPILGYSLENEYDGNAYNYLLNAHKQEIISSRGIINEASQREWNYYLTYEPTRWDTTYIIAQTTPLLTSNWNQTEFYNNHCPSQEGATQYQYETSGCDNHVPAGCVACDMSVLMYYYRWPEYGVGGVSYNPIHYEFNADNEPTDTIVYPRQTQSFAVFHDYNMMPDAIGTYTGEIAKLMWQAGISVQMDYGPDGSGAQSEEALNSMKNFWRYNRAAQYVARSSMSNDKWNDSIMRQIDLRQPVYYSGADNAGGHAFMVDGYRRYERVEEIVLQYTDTAILNHYDTIPVMQEDSTIIDSIVPVYDYVHIDSITRFDTTRYTHVHINWGWGGYNNGWFALTGSGHIGGYTNNEAIFLNCIPADQQPKETSGLVEVRGTRGSISDGAGNLAYEPNTDRSWMIAAPGATRYRITFSRMNTEPTNDYIAFYKNGNLNDEVGRYSGNTIPSAFNITADSVLVRFVTNGNDEVGYGFVFNFSATTPSAYCSEEVVISCPSSGIITDKGTSGVEEDVNYRPDSRCSWRINGFEVLYLAYPKIELGLGDFVDIIDVTKINQHYLIKRIDQYNWPTEDVITLDGTTHKVMVTFVSDNYDEGTGFELTYETLTGIEENSGLSNITVYPNPASSLLNIDLTADVEGQLTFKVMDMTGKVISVESLENYGGELHHSLNVSNLAKGMYILNIESQQGKNIRKFIVE